MPTSRTTVHCLPLPSSLSSQFSLLTRGYNLRGQYLRIPLTRFSSRRGTEFVSFVSYRGQMSWFMLATHRTNHLPILETQATSCPCIQLRHKACQDNFSRVYTKNFKVATEGGRDQKELKGHAIDSGICYQLGVVSGWFCFS